MLKIECFEIGPIGTDCYFISNTETKELAIVDPAIFHELLLQKVKEEQLQPAAILLTHGHHDHIMGVPGWQNAFPDLPVYGGKEEEDVFEDARKNLSFRFGEYAVSVKPEHLLSDREEFTLLGQKVRFLHTPGHTHGSGCFYFENAEKTEFSVQDTLFTSPVLFSGDTLFQMSMGRCDLPTGDERAIMQSLSRLAVLPEDTLVFPGHGPATQIGFEKKHNPYIR